MIALFYNQNGVIFSISIVCIFSLMVKLIFSFRYQNLINESDQMGETRDRLLINIKQRFESEYEKAFCVNNVSVFVDKYMYNMRILMLRPTTWESLGMFAILFCLLIGSTGSLYAFSFDLGREEIIGHILEGVIASGILVLVDTLVNVQRKKEPLHVNICDYLENYMKPRLERGEYDYDINQLTRLADEVDEGMLALIKSMDCSSKRKKDESEKQFIFQQSTKEEVEETKVGPIVLSEDEEQILEDVLKEYLT